MAVLMTIELPGATTEQYDRVNEMLGIHGDDDAPDGLVSHVTGATGNGMFVADVWESPESMRRFVEGRMLAAAEEAGMPEAEPTVQPVHNLIVQGAGRAANVIMVAGVAGFGPDAYDRMTSQMDAHAGDGSRHPAVSHVAAVTDSGMLVVDVWDSPEAFGRFAETQIGPAAEAAGLPPIEPRFIPVHNRIRGQAPAAV
jgi:hypothetical protein